MAQRGKPYSAKLDRGVFLDYRKNLSGGTWWARLVRKPGNVERWIDPLEVRREYSRYFHVSSERGTDGGQAQATVPLGVALHHVFSNP